MDFLSDGPCCQKMKKTKKKEERKKERKKEGKKEGKKESGANKATAIKMSCF